MTAFKKDNLLQAILPDHRGRVYFTEAFYNPTLVIPYVLFDRL